MHLLNNVLHQEHNRQKASTTTENKITGQTNDLYKRMFTCDRDSVITAHNKHVVNNLKKYLQ